jgi:hypothetical protein
MLRRITKRRVFAALSIVAALALAVSAYAYFGASASSGVQPAGHYSTDNVQGQTLTVASNGLTGNPLVPGGSAQTVYFTVTNPGPNPVLAPVLTASIEQNGNGEVADQTQGGYDSGCYANWFKLGTPMFYSGVNGDGGISSGATAYGRVLVSMPASNVDQNKCEGATPKVDVSVTGTIKVGADTTVLGTYQTTGDEDSAVGGGNWATDDFARTYTVEHQPNGTYNVTEHFLGTFTTLNGGSPADPKVSIPAGIKGRMVGDYTFTGVSGSFDPNATCVPSSNGGQNDACSTAAFFAAHFGIPEPASYGWAFTYSSNSSTDTWVNADSGNSGNITG